MQKGRNQHVIWRDNAMSEVNPQITDAVTQVNVKVLAESPAMSLSNLYQTISQSLSLSAQNAVTSQQQTNIVHQAATTQGVSLLYSVDTASTAEGTAEIFRSTSQNIATDAAGIAEIIKATNS